MAGFEERKHPRRRDGTFSHKRENTVRPPAANAIPTVPSPARQVGQDPDLDDVLAVAGKLQAIVKDAVLVGGSAAAAHAHHRLSFGDDHVLSDLRERFDQALDALEATDGWVTARVKRPVLILGSLDGVETGIRQLIRRRPLEVERIEVKGRAVTILTLAETTRVKAWLVLRRNATRDYLDLAALSHRLGIEESARVLDALDQWYEDQRGPGGKRVATQVARQLADPRPYDLSDVDLAHYRHLQPRWQDWDEVVDQCRGVATAMLSSLPGDEGEGR
ncbi:MAG: hypothetical protein ACRD0J_01020 [Acidimicrobiales bacterium]